MLKLLQYYLDYLEGSNYLHHSSTHRLSSSPLDTMESSSNYTYGVSSLVFCIHKLHIIEAYYLYQSLTNRVSCLHNN